MSKAEIEFYFNWFMERLPSRIEMLESTVRGMSFPQWSADCTKCSLQNLGEWYAGQIRTEPRSIEEQTQLANTNPMAPANDLSWKLTNLTYSYAVDVGIYMAETLRHQFEFLRWEPMLKDKKDTDYGQAVLIGVGQVPLNPVAIMITLAWGIARKTYSSSRLSELYSFWAEILANETDGQVPGIPLSHLPPRRGLRRTNRRKG